MSVSHGYLRHLEPFHSIQFHSIQFNSIHRHSWMGMMHHNNSYVSVPTEPFNSIPIEFYLNPWCKISGDWVNLPVINPLKRFSGSNAYKFRCVSDIYRLTGYQTKVQTLIVYDHKSTKNRKTFKVIFKKSYIRHSWELAATTSSLCDWKIVILTIIQNNISFNSLIKSNGHVTSSNFTRTYGRLSVSSMPKQFSISKL